ncbi:MAG TPA: hypothetical protein VF278_06065 [Pirellulales bacterium]
MTIEIMTDPVELAKARAQRERFDRNAAWLQAHAHEVYPQCRGKYMCIAGEELFIGKTPQEAIAAATTAHPDDNGRFFRFIPEKNLPSIYGNSRRMVPL